MRRIEHRKLDVRNLFIFLWFLISQSLWNSHTYSHCQKETFYANYFEHKEPAEKNLSRKISFEKKKANQQSNCRKEEYDHVFTKEKYCDRLNGNLPKLTLISQFIEEKKRAEEDIPFLMTIQPIRVVVFFSESLSELMMMIWDLRHPTISLVGEGSLYVHSRSRKTHRWEKKEIFLCFSFQPDWRHLRLIFPNMKKWKKKPQKSTIFF